MRESILQNPKRANNNLLKKVLWPYILLLLTLAIVISLGSSMLLQSRLLSSTKHRLEHVQGQAYGDFKDLEHWLAKNIQQILNQPNFSAEQIQRTLLPYERHLEITLTTLNQPGHAEQLKAFLTKAQARDSVYISTFHDPAKGEILAAVQHLPDGRFLIVSHPLGKSYLDELKDRYESQFYLLKQDGTPIDSSTGTDYIPHLSSAELQQMRSGKPVVEITEEKKTQFISYSPLPLGHDGMFLLGTAQYLSEIEDLILKHRLYLLCIIGLGLLLCITLFRSLLIRMFSPLSALLEVNEKVKAGNRKARIKVSGNKHSQLDQLCIDCNQLLDQLAEHESRIEVLTGQLSKMEELKAHNKHLRKSNLDLETRTISLKDQNQELSALFKITQSLATSLDQQLLYERILQTLKETLNCSLCVLYIFKPGTDSLRAVKVQGIYGVELKTISTELGESIAGEAALNQKAVYQPDLSKEDKKPLYGTEAIDQGALLAVPLTAQNRLVGVINLHQKNCNAFSQTAQQIAQAIANQAAIAIENARLYEKAKTLSATDELTGLANRRQFQEYLLRELAQSRRQHNSFSILMIDIDHFKQYNDYHGHLKGDIVLKKVSSLLLQNTRGVDLVARFGGEEFIMLLPKSDKTNSLAVAEKLRMCIEEENFAGAEQSQPGQRLTISVGVSHFPTDSSDIYDLLNLADSALYEAKRKGRNTCIGWTPDTSDDLSANKK